MIVLTKIILRDVKESDWDVLVRIRNEPDVRNASHNTSFFTPEKYKEYINNQISQNEKNCHWAVILDENEIIGHAKIINQELGYLISGRFRNQGIGSKTISLLFEKAREIGFSEVFDIVKVNQPISLWVAIKNKFTMIGVISDKNSIPYAYKLVMNLK